MIGCGVRERVGRSMVCLMVSRFHGWVSKRWSVAPIGGEGGCAHEWVSRTLSRGVHLLRDMLGSCRVTEVFTLTSNSSDCFLEGIRTSPCTTRSSTATTKPMERPQRGEACKRQSLSTTNFIRMNRSTDARSDVSRLSELGLKTSRESLRASRPADVKITRVTIKTQWIRKHRLE